MVDSGGYNADGWVPKPGDVLDDRYRVEEHLDRGGMGVVVRAFDTHAERQVAIKFLSPRVAKNETYRARFRREIDVIRDVRHPNLLQSYAYGEAHGGLYVVTELLEGFSLRGVIRREGRLSTRRTMEIAVEVLEGLSAAHAVDVIHRDIKPDNVFVADDGRVKVLDFGLAKSISSEDNRLTATGMICGTAAYVAPEILVVEDPGKPADVYAVALVVLEMLIGRQVFVSSSTSQTFMQQLVVPARIPRRIWDTELGHVLVRALNKHPDVRYEDACTMLPAMRAAAELTKDFVLDKEEIPPPPPDDLSGFLLDHLADGRSRTKDTLHRLPKPEAYDPEGPHPDDKATLQIVMSDITSAEHVLTTPEAERPTLFATDDSQKATVPVHLQGTDILPADSLGLVTTRAPGVEDDDEELRVAGKSNAGVLVAVAVVVLALGAFVLWPDGRQVGEQAREDSPTERAAAPAPPRPAKTAEAEPTDLEPIEEVEPTPASADAEPSPAAEAVVAADVDVAEEPDEPTAEVASETQDVRQSPPTKKKRRKEAHGEPTTVDPSKAPADKAADELVDKYLPTFE